MSLKYSKNVYFISHEALINEAYNNVDDIKSTYRINKHLFDIWAPYKVPKSSKRNDNLKNKEPFEAEVRFVEKTYNQFYTENKAVFTETNFEVRNTNVLKLSAEIYSKSGENLIADLYGANPDDAITKSFSNVKFLFPRNWDEKYDLILLDPPWWNKYIRRKRKHSDHAYNMMYNDDLKSLPLESYLKKDGLVVVWCTNSNQNLDALINDIFPKWGVKFWGKWYWVKITKRGEPICAFSEPPRKQPFEQIVFGVREERQGNPPVDKVVLSVPSALHSHKPPLSEILKDFLPPNPNCLELFARYLLPNWTSYGNEVLRFQHESLYLKK